MTRRRAILLYVVVIAVPASVLLFFGIQSFERQRKAVSALMRSNSRFSGERLASELEKQTAQLAEAVEVVRRRENQQIQVAAKTPLRRRTRTPGRP